MNYQIKNLRLSVERQLDRPKNIQYNDDNTDVIIEMENGDIYVSSFFTYRNLETLRKQHQKNGKFLAGKYFWANRMLFAEDITPENVQSIILDLIEEGDFEKVFDKI